MILTAGLDDTSLDTSNGHRANTANLVDILEGKTEGLVSWSLWGINGVNGFQEGLASGLGLGLLLPSLVPWAVGRDIDHVVAIETRDWDEWHSLGVVAHLLDEVGGLLDDFIVSIFRPLGGVHLVDGDDELLDTQGVGKQSVLTGLTVFGDTGFEFTSASSDNQDSTVGLGSTRDHVLDKITMAGGV